MKTRLTVALVFAFAGCAGVVPSATPDSAVSLPRSSVTRPPVGSTGIVGEYFSLADEASGDGVAWKDRLRPLTPLAKLTRLYIFGGWLRKDTTGKYTLQLEHPYEQPRLGELLTAARAKNPSAQLFIVSGYDDGSMYEGALKNPKYFADSVVSFVRTYKLDGYDCDWENGINKAGLIQLATAIRNALDAAGKVDGKKYLFTMAVWPTPQGRYDLRHLSPLLDQIEIMSYGEGEKLPADTAAYVDGGFLRSKIVGGVETERDYPGPGGVDTLGPKGSIAGKTAYALKNGLAGMMAWRMDNDYDVTAPEKQPSYDGAVQLWKSMTGH